MTHHPNPARDDAVMKRIRGLLQAMTENEPDDDAADAVTCWMVWKKEAADLLALLNGSDPACAVLGHAFVQRVHWCCEHCGAEMRSDAP